MLKLETSPTDISTHVGQISQAQERKRERNFKSDSEFTIPFYAQQAANSGRLRASFDVKRDILTGFRGVR